MVGSINLDIVAQSERLPLPGETVFGKQLGYFPGGKGANQAIAACRGGAETLMVGCIGGDEAAGVLSKFLRENGVNVTHVRAEIAEASGSGLIIVDPQGENQIVVVPGANDCVRRADITGVDVRQGDVLVCQFEIPMDTVIEALKLAQSRGAVTILNPAPARDASADVFSLADIIVLNQTELSFLIGATVDNPSNKNLAQALEKIDGLRSDGAVIVTAGERGGFVRLNGETFSYLGRRVPALDTTAAGDCFVGSLAACLVTAGPALDRAVDYANVAASICIQRPGAGPSMPTRAEVLDALKKHVGDFVRA